MARGLARAPVAGGGAMTCSVAGCREEAKVFTPKGRWRCPAHQAEWDGEREKVEV